MSRATLQPTLKGPVLPGNEKKRGAPALPLTLLPPAPPADGAPGPRKQRTSNDLTIEGTLFIGLALLIGLAAVNTGANLLYLVLSMMLSMLILSGFIARLNLRRITVRRLYPLEFHAGQTIEATLDALNGKRWLHSYSLGLRDTIHGPAEPGDEARGWRWGRGRKTPAQEPRGFAMNVVPRGRTACPVRFCLPRRGLYTLGPIRILTRFPFGFFEKIVSADEPGQLLVYPRLVPVMALLAHCPAPLGLKALDAKGQSAGIYGVRDYQDGDPARIIHWKLSAKGGGIKVKEFEQEEEKAFRLMLDLRCPADPQPALIEDFEKAVSVTATLARTLARQEATVGLWTTAGNVPLGNGARHLQRIMRALAQVRPLPPDARVVLPEREGAQVTQLWVDYQEAGGPRLAPASRRGPEQRYAIDARKVEFPALGNTDREENDE